MYTRGPGAPDGGEIVLAVLFSRKCYLSLRSDERNNYVLLKPGPDNRVIYHFLAFWSGEPEPIPGQGQLEDYLSRINRLEANPIVVGEIAAERK